MGLTCQENKRMISFTKVMTSGFVILSGESVMHESIRVLETEVTRDRWFPH